MSNLAEQLEENEQYDKAYEEYKKLHIQRPKSTEILGRLGHLALILDKNDEAAEYYSKILELEPENEVAYEQLMDVYFHTDRYKYYVSRGNLHVIQQQLSHAINDFKKALGKAQSEEESNTVRFVLAGLYEQTGKNNNAIDEYLRILDTEAVNEAVFINLANLYLKENSETGAIETLNRAIEREFNSDAVKEMLAHVYLKSGETQKAREFSADDLVKIRSLLDEGKNEEAFSILQSIKDNYLKNSQYHLLSAQYYFNTQNWDKSLECVEQFDKFEQNSPLTYQMRAMIYEEKGNNFEAFMNWAKFNMLKGEKELALNEYYNAFQVDNKNADLIQRIAELLEDIGDKNQAGEFWERLTKVDLNNKKALEKLSDFRESIGDYRGQIEFLEKLIQLDNKKPQLVKKLAVAYEKLKNKEKALEYYNKFIEMAPISDECQQIKEKISKLQNVEMVEEEGILDKLMRLFAKN